MDATEARRLLDQELNRFRRLSYSELVNLVATNEAVRVTGPSGVEYQVEIEVLWDSPRDKMNVRVIGGVDDGRFLSALCPFCKSFVVGPSGEILE